MLIDAKKYLKFHVFILRCLFPVHSLFSALGFWRFLLFVFVLIINNFRFRNYAFQTQPEITWLKSAFIGHSHFSSEIARIIISRP